MRLSQIFIEVEVKTLHGGRNRDWGLRGKVSLHDDGVLQ